MIEYEKKLGKSQNIKCFQKEVVFEQIEKRISKNSTLKRFIFDKVYDEHSTQLDVRSLYLKYEFNF